MASARDTIGPFLSVYLKANYNYDSLSIGIAIASSNFFGLISQIPAGALIDKIKNKKIVVQLSLLTTAFSLLIILKEKFLSFIVLANGLIGFTTGILTPTVSAISLGIVGSEKFANRIGRNETLLHIGNVVATLLAAIIAFYLGNQSIFYFIACLSIASIYSIHRIKNQDIDYELSRGGIKKDINNKEVDIKLLDSLKNRHIINLFVTFFIFHFANAALLPDIGQKLSDGKSHLSSVYMSSCIIISQLVMIPVAILTSRYIQRIGLKKLFIIGFFALPIRAILFSLTNSPILLICFQGLDGISAGVFGVTSTVMIANAIAGSGRFNFILGCASSIIGLGATVSNIVSGYLIKSYGYNRNFMYLAIIGIIGIIYAQIFIKEDNINH